MASSYSYDLRTKLFKALDDGLSIVKACKIFNIGRNTIYRWKALKYETGDIKAKPYGPAKGYNARITLKEFEELIINNHDKTAKELSIILGIEKPQEIGTCYAITNNYGKHLYLLYKNENIQSSDCTYFLWSCYIIDWHSKAILSYKLSNSMDASLVTDVLKQALSKYNAPKIFNSDQGSQYTSYEHINIIKEYDIQISMNGKGRSIDNIVIERFFRTLKYNCIFINDFNNVKELK